MKKEIKKELQCAKCGTKYQEIIYICKDPKCKGNVLIKKQEQELPPRFFS